MREFGGRDAPGGDLLLLAACVGMALLAYALPRAWAADVVGAMRRTALRPVVALQARAASDRTSRFRLAGIERERDSMALQLLADTALRDENSQLRRLLALRERHAPGWIPAEVLHQPTPTDARTLLLGVGSADGVARNDPVVTPDGLIGVVWNVGPRSAAVLTWMHPEWRASALTLEGGVLGILAPTVVGSSGQAMLELRGVAFRDTLAIGTRVYTAGLGGVYQRMLPVGRIVGVGRDPMGYERRYIVSPFAVPSAASHVMVLTSPRDSTFAGFETGDTLP